MPPCAGKRLCEPLVARASLVTAAQRLARELRTREVRAGLCLSYLSGIDGILDVTYHVSLEAAMDLTMYLSSEFTIQLTVEGTMHVTLYATMNVTFDAILHASLDGL